MSIDPYAASINQKNYSERPVNALSPDASGQTVLVMIGKLKCFFFIIKGTTTKTGSNISSCTILA